jgi:hypothetical protein
MNDQHLPTPLRTGLQRQHTRVARKILSLAYAGQGKPFTWTDSEIEAFNVKLDAIAVEILARRDRRS